MPVLKIAIGERVLCNGVIYVVKRVISADVVIGWDNERKSLCELLVNDLVPPPGVDPVRPKPVVAYLSANDEQVINTKFTVIEPLLYGQRTRVKVEQQAKVAMSLGLLRIGSPSTIYRWLNEYKTRRKKIDLMRAKPTGGYSKSRLPYLVEELLRQVIESKYLTSQKLSKVAICEEVAKAFVRENEDRQESYKLKCPCEKTIRKRLNQRYMEEVVMARDGEKAADEKFGLNSGELICGRWPWDIIQMDHTELNIFFIDQETGDALWRPWVTAAIDTFSRVIVAFVLSPCKPSASTLALCYSMAMLPKEMWVERWGFSKEETPTVFPVWGRPQLSQFDNAWEHEAKSLKAGCELNGLSYEFRFLKNPKQGAFIESFFRTLKNEVAKWPGTTFHGPKDRQNYDSEKKATMTLPRLEQALANYIIRIYHNKKHKGLNNSPLDTYKAGLIDSGVGIPDKLYGREAIELALDFMPYEMRTIQKYGFSLNGIQYSEHILKSYAARTALSPTGKPLKKKFAIKILPWDVSSAYLYDEALKSYVKIPCSDSSLPSISLDEYRYLKSMLKKQRVNPSAENIIRARIHLERIITGSIKEKGQILRKYKKTKAKAEDSNKMPSLKGSIEKHARKEVSEDQQVKPFSTFRIRDER